MVNKSTKPFMVSLSNHEAPFDRLRANEAFLRLIVSSSRPACDCVGGMFVGIAGTNGNRRAAADRSAHCRSNGGSDGGTHSDNRADADARAHQQVARRRVGNHRPDEPRLASRGRGAERAGQHPRQAGAHHHGLHRTRRNHRGIGAQKPGSWEWATSRRTRPTPTSPRTSRRLTRFPATRRPSSPKRRTWSSPVRSSRRRLSRRCRRPASPSSRPS